MHQNDAFQQAEIPTLPPLELPLASDSPPGNFRCKVVQRWELGSRARPLKPAPNMLLKSNDNRTQIEDASMKKYMNYFAHKWKSMTLDANWLSLMMTVAGRCVAQNSAVQKMSGCRCRSYKLIPYSSTSYPWPMTQFCWEHNDKIGWCYCIR